MSMEPQVLLITLPQLNRSAKQQADRRSVLSDLRESALAFQPVSTRCVQHKEACDAKLACTII